MTSNLQSLTAMAAFLRGRANRYAWAGLAIALAAILVATLLCSAQSGAGFDLAALIAAQLRNPALWLLDAMPLLFLAWGQHIGTVMSFQAGALVLDEIDALHESTASLREELEQASAPGHDLGLPNRHVFTNELDLTLQQRNLGGGRCAVFAIAAEPYATLASGEHAGAAAEFLGQLAARLRSVAGADDLLAHFGHDHFALLMRDVLDEGEAMRLASRVQLAMETPLDVRRCALPARTSIGIALAPGHGSDAATLLRRAEAARLAGAAERRDFQVFDAASEDAWLARARLVGELHHAIHHAGLTDEYARIAPQGARPPRLRLVPAWTHPRRGRIEERELLGLLDRRNLAHSITLWLLGEGLTRLAAWRASEPRLELVMRLPDAALRFLPLADLATRLLGAHDLPSRSLTLEFAETAVASGAHARSQLAALRSAQVNVCAGGIGQTGGAVTTPLYQPVNEVCFAPVILQRAAREAVAAEVLQHLLACAHALDARITLSGVDGEELRAFAARLGVDYAEGAAIGAPLEADAVAALLTRSSAA